MKRLLEIWRLLNLPCRDMAALSSRALDERLPSWERFALRLHLLYCRACRRYVHQVRQLRDVLREAARKLEADHGPARPGLPADIRERMIRNLRQRS